MLTVHHLENSRSQRILWLLEELEVPYEVKRYRRDPDTSLAPEALQAVHPLGKSPVITDDGNTLAESGAIIDYLVETYGNGQLVPAAGSPDRLTYRYWLHYAEGTFMPLMVMSLIMSRIETAPAPFFVKPIARGIAGKIRQGYLGPNIGRNLGYLEKTLSATRWFAGDQFTAADIQMSFPIEAAAARIGLEPDYPELLGFLQRIHDRPAYQRALEMGGPYDLLG